MKLKNMPDTVSTKSWKVLLTQRTQNKKVCEAIKKRLLGRFSALWGNAPPCWGMGVGGASCLITPYIKTYKNQRGDPARKGWGAQRLGNNCISHTHLRKKLDFMRVSGHFFFRNFICFWYQITSQELKVATVRKEKTGCISTPGFLDFFNHFR